MNIKISPYSDYNYADEQILVYLSSISGSNYKMISLPELLDGNYNRML